jgi:hypothetical protein
MSCAFTTNVKVKSSEKEYVHNIHYIKACGKNAARAAMFLR